MSKRKIRKLRHRTDQKPMLTFKQLTEMGNVRVKLAKGLITPEQIPAWMMGEAPVKIAAPQVFGDPAEHSEPHEHVHGEHCNHEHE